LMLTNYAETYSNSHYREEETWTAGWL
jgi:hypothetical protein